MEHRIHTMPHDAFEAVKAQIERQKKATKKALAVESRRELYVNSYILDHSIDYFGYKNLVRVRIVGEEDIIREPNGFGSTDAKDRYGKAYHFGQVEKAERGRQLRLRITDLMTGKVEEKICTRDYFVTAIETGSLEAYNHRRVNILMEARQRAELKRRIDAAWDECQNFWTSYEKPVEKKAPKPKPQPVDFHDALAGILDNMLNQNVEYTDYED